MATATSALSFVFRTDGPKLDGALRVFARPLPSLMRPHPDLSCFSSSLERCTYISPIRDRTWARLLADGAVAGAGGARRGIKSGEGEGRHRGGPEITPRATRTHAPFLPLGLFSPFLSAASRQLPPDAVCEMSPCRNFVRRTRTRTRDPQAPANGRPASHQVQSCVEMESVC